MGLLFSGLKTTYQVLHTIGQGGFGKVYMVRSPANEVYALKRGAIQNDLAVLQKLCPHKNIISLSDYGICLTIQGFQPFIVTELCNQGDLNSYITGNKQLQFDYLMSDMIDALSFIHGQGLVHRDLKPGNILVHYTLDMPRAVFKISDFGTSKFVDLDLTEPILNTHWESPYYKAPEVGMGPYNMKCDIFSFGVIIFALFSKQPLPALVWYDSLSKTNLEIKLCNATNEQIYHAVNILIGGEPHLRDMLCQMLRIQFRERANIGEVAQMYDMYHKSLLNSTPVTVAPNCVSQVLTVASHCVSQVPTVAPQCVSQVLTVNRPITAC